MAAAQSKCSPRDKLFKRRALKTWLVSEEAQCPVPAINFSLVPANFTGHPLGSLQSALGLASCPFQPVTHTMAWGHTVPSQEGGGRGGASETLRMQLSVTTRYGQHMCVLVGCGMWLPYICARGCHMCVCVYKAAMCVHVAALYV